MKKIISALAITMLSSSAFAAGQDAMYFGGSLGFSNYDTNTAVEAGERLDETDTAFKVFLGQKINSIFSIEGHYANLGKTEYSGPGFYASAKTQSFGVSGLAGFNITNSLRGFGKVGVHYWNDKVEVRGGVVDGKDNGIDPLFGGGLEYAIDKKLSIRGEYEMFMGENDTSLISVGLSYKF